MVLIEEEHEVEDMDEVQVRQAKLKKELQHLEIKMEMMEIKYRTMVDSILVPLFQWKLKTSSCKQKCPLSFQCCEAEECCYYWHAKYMEPPHNMLFRMHCFRMGWDPKNKKQKYYRQNFLSNAYFCLCKMDCLQKIVPGVKCKHLYMGIYYFQSLTQEHMDLLKQYSYWDHILNSQKQLIDEAQVNIRVMVKMSKISTYMLNILF